MKFLNQFIQNGDPLDRLRSSAAKLAALTHRIRAVLPEETRMHVVGCAPRPGTVVVLADSAAWAAQLRYQQQAILAVCRETFGERVQQVRFKVLPPESPAGNPPAPELTEKARSLLRGTASGIADDELAAALRRLSGDQDAE